MVELADTLDLGFSGFSVQVQILLPAPLVGSLSLHFCEPALFICVPSEFNSVCLSFLAGRIRRPV